MGVRRLEGQPEGADGGGANWLSFSVVKFTWDFKRDLNFTNVGTNVGTVDTGTNTNVGMIHINVGMKFND